MNMTTSQRPQTIHIYNDRLLDSVSDETRSLLAPYNLITLEGDDEAFLSALPEIEVLFGYGMPRGHWASAQRLRLIQTPGAGVDSLLPAPDLAEHVLLANASGVHEPHMPEFVLAQLLALAYQIPRTVRRQDNHVWRTSFPTMTLSGKTLCIVGLGVIGQSVARRAKALGMRITGVRRSGEPIEGIDLVVTPDNRHEALTQADAVVVITPLTSETRGLIGEKELAALRPGSLFVDVSRGGVSHTAAVVAALASGQLGGASMDVFEPEPLPGDSPLWDVPNLLITPHSAGMSPGYVDRLVRVLLASIEAMTNGAPLPNAVDRTLGY